MFYIRLISLLNIKLKNNLLQNRIKKDQNVKALMAQLARTQSSNELNLSSNPSIYLKGKYFVLK